MLTMLLLMLASAGDSAHAEVLAPTVVVDPGMNRMATIKPPEEKVAEFIAKDWDLIEESRPNDVLMECCYEYVEHQ